MWKKILAALMWIIGRAICYYCKRYQKCIATEVPGMKELQPVCGECAAKPQPGVVDDSTKQP